MRRWSGAPQCDLLQHTRFDRRLSGYRHSRVWQFAQRSNGLQHWFKLKALLREALYALIDSCSAGQPVEAFLQHIRECIVHARPEFATPNARR
jgi:hypothetical protein